MQATDPLKRFPTQIVAFACGLLAAAIVGAAGGYALRSFDHQATSTAAAATTSRVSSMVGENARADAIDSVVATQPSLVGENGQLSQPAQKLREGHRR
jgi:hypothetical protein